MQQTDVLPQHMTFNEGVFYSGDHEWINFQGSIAYVGICTFKLTGIKAIERIDFSDATNFFEANDVIGSLYYAEYKIDIHIPVSGRVLSFNECLVNDNTDPLLKSPETEGWFALIVPAAPSDKSTLLTLRQYHQKTRKPWEVTAC